MQFLSQLGFVFVAMISFAPIVLAEQPEPVGSVAALQGKATVIHAASTEPELLAVQSSLYPVDIVQTEADSKIKLQFIDGTVMALGEKSKLLITSFVYAPMKKAHSAFFTIPQGIFRAIARKILPQSRFEVTTTNTVAALRGTDWLGEVTPDLTSIVVLDGRVTVSHTGTDIPGEVVLTKGMGTDVDRWQPPSPAKRWGQNRVEALKKATALP